MFRSLKEYQKSARNLPVKTSYLPRGFGREDELSKTDHKSYKTRRVKQEAVELLSER